VRAGNWPVNGLMFALLALLVGLARRYRPRE
jgi:hypothetical protein